MTSGSRTKRQRDLWDQESSAYDDVQQRRFGGLFNEVIRRACGHLEATSDVVEIGCGSGIVTVGVARTVRHLTALDISGRMLGIARQKALRVAAENITFVQGDAYRLPHANGSFNAALCCYVLDIVERPDVVLREAHRVLRDGGVLISVTDCYQDTRSASPARTIARELVRVVRHALRSAGIARRRLGRPRDTELVRLMSQAGFRVLDTSILEIGEPGLFNLYVRAAKL